jgi:hypothetical protein
MQANKKFYWQYFLNRFFTKEKRKVKNNIITTPYNSTLQLIRTTTFTSLSVVTLFFFMANAMAITSDMSPEVTAEFKKQLDLQTWPAMHTKLALMDNPYKKFYKAIKKKLTEEAEAGNRRRLMTHEESTLAAKKKRFDYCQSSVHFFVDFAKRAHTLGVVVEPLLTKDQLMTGNGVKYPFTPEQAENGNFRPAQLALELGWKYKGKGEEYAETFLKACLAIPVSLYYKEDKF